MLFFQKLKWQGAALSFVIAGMCVPLHASAISISPLRQTVSVDPGSAQVLQLDVDNTDTKDVTVAPAVDAFTVDQKTGRAVFGAVDEAVQWVACEPSSLTLKSGERGTFHCTATVPSHAQPGGHYLGLFAENKPAEGQVGVGSRVGSLIFLTVSGEIRESLVVEQFAPDRLVTFSPTVTLSALIKNAGNVYVQPKGEIIIYGMTNNEVRRIPINQSGRKVLPDGTWQEEFFVPLDVRTAGRTSMRLHLQYGATGQTAVSTAVLWYVPPQAFYLLVIVGAVGLFWYVAARRRAL